MHPNGTVFRAALALLLAYLTAATAAESTATQANREKLTTAPVKRDTVTRLFRLDGVVEAINETTVSSRTSGEIVAIDFDVNDYVDKGAVIVRLKDTEQKAQVRKAEAAKREAQAQLSKALKEFRRVKDIYEKKLVAKSALDDARAALQTARARFEAAEAALAQANEQLSYTRVHAPYSGVVTKRHVELGETATPGQPLMTGISLDQLRVKVEVPQSLIARIRKYGKARVETPDGVVEATKMTIFPFADPRTNSFLVRLDLPEGIHGLFPGMFVKVGLVIGEKQQLVIPKQAVAHRSEVTGVYVVDDRGGLHFRHVRLGDDLGDGRVAVLAGLDEGERVALDPVAATALLKQQRASTHDE